MSDEAAIRQVVDTWMDATRNGDLATILTLMTDDVLFMVPGREPFGKDAFAASFNCSMAHCVRAAGSPRTCGAAKPSNNAS